MPSIRFGACLLDAEARQLLRDGQPVHLSPKAFELLRILVTERPKAIAKAQLHERIWPGVFVTDDSLTKLVSEARTAIGDHPRTPTFLRTVHGFGYAFSGVSEDPSISTNGAMPGSTCCLIVDGRSVLLTPGDTIIGRDPVAQIVLDSVQVSRRHARVHVEEQRATVEDLGSRNGTSVNGERVTGAVTLRDGDEITIASFTLRFWTAAGSIETEAADG